MTVQEILKQTGFTDEQIAALDARAITAFTGVMTTAELAQQAAVQAAAKAEADRVAAQAALDNAELVKRSNTEFYETKVIPGLTGWEAEQTRLLTEKANADALAAFYKAQNDSARTAGFVPADAPAFTPAAGAQPPRNPAGQYVAGGNQGTPGSPSFQLDPNQIAGRIGDVAGSISDLQWKYQQLYGQPLPIAPSQLIAEADQQKLSPTDYAARKFNFAARETELAAQRKAADDDKLRKEEAARVTAEFEAKIKTMQDEQTAKDRARAEQVGNNPDVRQAPGASKFAEITRAVKAGERPDPLSMTDAQRRAATRQQIHAEISENAAVA